MTSYMADHPIRHTLAWALSAVMEEKPVEELHPDDVLYQCARVQLPVCEAMGRRLIFEELPPHTSILRALRAGEARIAFRILDWTRGVGKDGASGYTPLGYAVEYDREPWVCRLQKLGANPNRLHRGDPPLTYAIRRGSKPLIIRLLRMGADKLKPGRNNITPLDVALDESTPAIALMVETWDPKLMLLGEADAKTRFEREYAGKENAKDEDEGCHEAPEAPTDIIDAILSLQRLANHPRHFEELLGESGLSELGLKLVINALDPVAHRAAIKTIKMHYAKELRRQHRRQQATTETAGRLRPTLATA